VIEARVGTTRYDRDAVASTCRARILETITLESNAENIRYTMEHGLVH
jgi:hypothetical protein